MATQKIFARSPYYVAYKAGANTIATVKVNVWAYEGVKTTDRPTNPIYTLKKTASVNEGGYEWWTFEIAELLKDYLPKVGNPTTYPATAMWGAVEIVKTSDSGTTIVSDIQDYAVFDGYLKFEEGSQSVVGTYSSTGGGSVSLAFDSPPTNDFFTEIEKNENFFKSTDKGSTFVPVYQEETGSAVSVSFYTGAGPYPIQAVPSTDSSDIIQYLIMPTSTINTYGLRKATYQNFTITTYDTLDCIPDFTNNETGTKIWFVNRFGAIDKVTLMGLKTDSYETSKSEDRANIVGAKANGKWGYETYQRQKSILNKKGKRKFSLNTGWIAENYNDKIEDLLLSEQVWINPQSTQAYPVNILTSNIQEKTDANEKIINYAIEFEYANDIQNNIR
jgi:hypothetical protein